MLGWLKERRQHSDGEVDKHHMWRTLWSLTGRLYTGCTKPGQGTNGVGKRDKIKHGEVKDLQCGYKITISLSVHSFKRCKASSLKVEVFYSQHKALSQTSTLNTHGCCCETPFNYNDIHTHSMLTTGREHIFFLLTSEPVGIVTVFCMAVIARYA